VDGASGLKHQKRLVRLRVQNNVVLPSFEDAENIAEDLK
jgi:hypothetical protein